MSVQLDSAVGERLRFGEFELAPVARTLWHRGEEIRLGSRALDILIALASRPGQILSKDDLTQLVWRGPSLMTPLYGLGFRPFARLWVMAGTGTSPQSLGAAIALFSTLRRRLRGLRPHRLSS
jgi:hypothetical protein